MTVKQIRLAILEHYRPLVSGFCVLVASYFLYWFQLGTLVPGVNPLELHSSAQALHIHGLTHNPLDAPYKLLEYVFLQFGQHSIFWSRAVSALLATLASLLFFLIIRRWHGRSIAVIATLLFGATGWLLHVGRLDAPYIMIMLVPLLLIWLLTHIKNNSNPNVFVLVIAIIYGLLIYTPGAVWFLVIFASWQGQNIVAQAKKASPAYAIGAAVLFVLLFAAFVAGMVSHPGLIKPWLGIPASWPTPLTALRHAADSALYLFVRGPGNPEVWLGHLPLLDIFSTVLSGIGIYFYALHWRTNLYRLQIFASFIVATMLLMALGNVLFVGVLIPIMYLFAATGIAFLLRQWYAVFPRNPVARNAGLGLLVVAVVVAMTYHLISYFLAWQHNIDTVSLFRYPA